MFIDFCSLSAAERYKILTATVVPRPIALVTTLSASGIVNAAPFSFFNIFSEDPALAILGLEAHRDTGAIKDTTRNIIDQGELVINLVDRSIAEQMAACAANLEPDQSELPFAGLTSSASRLIAPPGIKEAPIRFECRLFEMRHITARRHLCIAEILAIEARSGILDPDSLHVDPQRYEAIGRLHGISYCDIATSFELRAGVPFNAPASGE